MSIESLGLVERIGGGYAHARRLEAKILGHGHIFTGVLRDTLPAHMHAPTALLTSTAFKHRQTTAFPSYLYA